MSTDCLKLFKVYHQYDETNVQTIVENLNNTQFNHDICQFSQEFLNIDRSNGYLLDIIGKLLLVPRPYYSIVKEVYHYDSYIEYDATPPKIYDHSIPEQLGLLDDESYRLLLKARAINRNINPTWDNIITQLHFIFPQANVIKLEQVAPMSLRATVNDSRYSYMGGILKEVSKYMSLGQGVSLEITENVMKYDLDTDKFDNEKSFA